MGDLYFVLRRHYIVFKLPVLHLTFRQGEVLLNAWHFGRNSGQDGEGNERTSEARREFPEPTMPGRETKFGSKG